MKSEFLVLARSSAIDLHSNSLSIFDIVDELEVNIIGEIKDTQPIPVDVQLLTSLAREDDDGRGLIQTIITLRTINSDGQKKDEPIGILFEPQHLRNRVRVGLRLAVTKTGSFTIQVLGEKENLLAEKKLPVKVVQSSGSGHT